MFRLLGSCVALTLAVLARGADADCSTTTSIDGQSFADCLTIDGATLLLTGGGTRYKYGVAKVYAVGLYVAESALGAGGTLAKWVGGDPKALAKDASFRNSLTKMQFPKVLLLQFHRAVDGPTVAKALNDALAKKLGADVLAAFKEALERVLAGGTEAGTKLFFKCGMSLGLVMGVGTHSGLASVDGAACRALLEVYYGDSPVSAQAKDGMLAGFARLQPPGGHAGEL